MLVRELLCYLSRPRHGTENSLDKLSIGFHCSCIQARILRNNRKHSQIFARFRIIGTGNLARWCPNHILLKCYLVGTLWCLRLKGFGKKNCLNFVWTEILGYYPKHSALRPFDLQKEYTHIRTSKQEISESYYCKFMFCLTRL